MSRPLFGIACLFLLTSGCSDPYVTVSTGPTGAYTGTATATGGSTNATTVTTDANAPAPVAGTWSTPETDTVMYSVDAALNDMFVFAPTTGSHAAINTTSSCATSFDTNGTTVIKGTYQPNLSGTGGSFQLTVSFANCPMKGLDGNVYTLNATNLNVSGSVTTAADNNGGHNEKFNGTSVQGVVDALDATDTNIECNIAVTNNVNYAWDNNVVITGTYSGSICGASASGSISHTLPVVVP